MFKQFQSNKSKKQSQQAGKLTFFSGISSFAKDPYTYTESLTHSQQRQLIQFLRLANIYGPVNASLQTIANRCGISRITSFRNAKIFREAGLVIGIKTHHRRPITYFLNPIFYEYGFRKRFEHLFKKVNWIGKGLSLAVMLSVKLFSDCFQCEYDNPFINSKFIKERVVVECYKTKSLLDKHSNVYNKVEKSLQTANHPPPKDYSLSNEGYKEADFGKTQQSPVKTNIVDLQKQLQTLQNSFNAIQASRLKIAASEQQSEDIATTKLKIAKCLALEATLTKEIDTIKKQLKMDIS
jgi:hypothetical protein